MKTTLLKQAACCLGVLLTVSSLVWAQAPAPTPQATQQAAPPPAAAAEATAKSAPTLPAGSTAAPGWNVPPKWDAVQSVPQYASLPGRETNVLVQDNGQAWRVFRNGPVTFYGGVLLLVAPALILLFFLIKGPFKLHDKPSGRLIERFNSAERMAHGTMALSFVVLALTGLALLFGKHVLLPVIGPTAFSWIAQIGKNIHNFIGPLFAFSIVATFLLYVKDNFFNSKDREWLSKFGGLLSGNHVPSGRFNGGEKVWFWLSVVVLGGAVSVSGIIMLFPSWDTGREMMTTANLVHAILAIAFVALSFAHIYMGTIGTEGALQGMKEGVVDEVWAREHHALWLEEVKAGKRPEKMVQAVAQPAAGAD